MRVAARRRVTRAIMAHKIMTLPGDMPGGLLIGGLEW